MRHLIYILILFPVVVLAQEQPGMPPNMPNMERMQQMQRHMQNMDMGKLQEAMACMKNVDMSVVKGLEAEGKKIEAELDALCQSGNLDGAQDKAMEYAMEMRDRPELQKLQECGKMAQGMLPKGAFEDLLEEGKNRHVCDDF